jgi:regulatory protein
MKELNAQEAYSRATALCSKSEKCISDVRKKLYDWHVEEEDHEAIIEALIENKYIDEERFSIYYVRDKYCFNHWGKVKIRYHLFQKGLSSHLVDKGIDGIDDAVYKENLLKALTTKNRNLKVEDKYERRQKLVRFAAGRGFSLDEINESLDLL